MFIIRLVFLLSVVLFTMTIDPVQVGLGSYSTEVPAGQESPQTTIFRVESLEDHPMPTNKWWSALAWQGSGNRAMFAHPLALAAHPDGLAVSYPNTPFIATRGDEYRYNFFEDFRVSVSGLSRASAPPLVVDFSDWTVTAAWDGDVMRATMGHGMPFVYFTTSSSDITLTFRQAPDVILNEDGSALVTIRGRAYGLFAPSGSTWTVEGEQLHAALNGKTYFSVAVLPDDTPETFAEFRARAFVFVTGSHVEWQYDEAASSVITTYMLETQVMEGSETATLSALYRHQWLYSQDVNTAYAYTSSRGEMRVVQGNSFTTTMLYPGILPALPAVDGLSIDELARGIDRVERFNNDNLRLNLPGPNGEADTYWTGKGLNRLAMLVPIAEQLGDTAARDAFLSTLRTRLEDWFSVSESGALPHFTYDSNWGVLIGYPAAGFGYQSRINDHHFHHGYFIYAAAMIAMRDPEWAALDQWGGMVDLLIRDANSPDADDPMFPRLRSFDVYAGHSWASGANDGDHGANQESSSEAMNFAAALILWGAAVNDPEMRDLGIYLYTTEMIAIQQYWFDVDHAVFPEGFDRSALGILWSDGGQYTTWWTQDPDAIHAINFLPITPASLYLGRTPDYLTENRADLIEQAGGEPDAFTDVLRLTYALTDPAAELAAYQANPPEPEWGETQTHALHWLETLNVLGRLDLTVTADSPFYAIFEREGVRIYAAYNPDAAERVVTFSDGVTLTVPPYEMATLSR